VTRLHAHPRFREDRAATRHCLLVYRLRSNLSGNAPFCSGNARSYRSELCCLAHDEQQEQIVEAVFAPVCPPGWTITQTAMNRTPDDWYTLDNRGFEIDGKNGEHVFQLLVSSKRLARDRQTRPNRLRLVTGEGVLVGQDFKTITNTDQAPATGSPTALSMSTPSLVNGGWHLAETVFKDRLPQVDSKRKRW